MAETDSFARCSGEQGTSQSYGTYIIISKILILNILISVGSDTKTFSRLNVRPHVGHIQDFSVFWCGTQMSPMLRLLSLA